MSEKNTDSYITFKGTGLTHRVLREDELEAEEDTRSALSLTKEFYNSAKALVDISPAYAVKIIELLHDVSTASQNAGNKRQLKKDFKTKYLVLLQFLRLKTEGTVYRHSEIARMLDVNRAATTQMFKFQLKHIKDEDIRQQLNDAMETHKDFTEGRLAGNKRKVRLMFEDSFIQEIEKFKIKGGNVKAFEQCLTAELYQVGAKTYLKVFTNIGTFIVRRKGLNVQRSKAGDMIILARWMSF
jgi:hypothetical protein